MKQKNVIGVSILVAALGYFVDIYDLILFSIVRIKSLKAIGIPDEQLLSQGVFLLNMQMMGMLLGGVLTESLGVRTMLIGLGAIYFVTTLSMAFIPAMKEMNRPREIAVEGA